MPPPLAREGQTLFSRLFPPPRFLEMRPAGLSISDDAITALQLVPSGGGRRRLGRFGRRPLPPGAVSGGALGDAEAVARELRSLRDELKSDFVRVSLSEEKAYLFETTLPSVPLGEARNAIELSLEENVPLAPREAVFDCALLARGNAGGAGDTYVVGAVPRGTAEAYADLVRAAGFLPVALCLEAEAIARAVLPFSPTDDAVLLLNMNAGKTGLFIVARGTVQFTSTVSVGCTHLTDAVGKFLGVGSEKAAAIQKGAPLPPGANASELLLSCANAVSVLKDEVVKLAAYWRTHGGAETAPIQKVVLAGLDAGFTGFDEYLSNAFGLPVEAGNVWRNAFSFDEYLPPIAFADSFAYTAAVGLAL